MKRGRISNQPVSRVWLDWKVLIPEFSWTLKLVTAVVDNSILFDLAAKKLPVDKSVLRWARKHHSVGVDVIVSGQQTGCLDQLLYKRLKGEWIKDVYYVDTFQEILEEMRAREEVLGYITIEKSLVSPENHVYEWLGSNMNISDLD